MNAVPTPRLEVGENVLAAQLLRSESGSASGCWYNEDTIKKRDQHTRYSHHQRKQAIVSADYEEEGEIGKANALLD